MRRCALGTAVLARLMLGLPSVRLSPALWKGAEPSSMHLEPLACRWLVITHALGLRTLILERIKDEQLLEAQLMPDKLAAALSGSTFYMNETLAAAWAAAPTRRVAIALKRESSCCAAVGAGADAGQAGGGAGRVGLLDSHQGAVPADARKPGPRARLLRRDVLHQRAVLRRQPVGRPLMLGRMQEACRVC